MTIAVNLIAAIASLFTSGLLLSLLVGIAPQADSRHVSIDVKAPWSRYAGSFAAEVSEFLSEESDDLFWKYVEAMCEHTVEYEGLEASSEDDSTTIGSSMQALAFEALPHSASVIASLHEYSDRAEPYAPTVEFFNDLAAKYGEPCGNRAFIVSYPGGKIHCDYSSFEHSVRSKNTTGEVMDISYYSSTSEDWDHVYRSESDSEDFSYSFDVARDHIVLYGTLGSQSFCSLHHKLVERKLRTLRAICCTLCAMHFLVRQQSPIAQDCKATVCG